MRKFATVILVACIGAVFAQTATPLRNSVGWDNGIAFRHCFSPKTWACLTVSGSFSNSRDSEKVVNTDTTSSITTHRYDSNYSYSASVKLALGKNFVQFKTVDIDAFAAVIYNYSHSKYSNNNGPNNQYNDNSGPASTITAELGLEPKIWIMNHISIGTQFGVQYGYTFGKSSEYYFYSPDDVSTSNGITRQWKLGTFGNVSLTSGLNVFFYF